MIASNRLVYKENLSIDKHALSPPEQKDSSVCHEQSPAIQAAHPPHDEICVSRLKVRRL
jgi:hypothetical protein